MANASSWLTEVNATFTVSVIPDNSSTVTVATHMLWGAAALALIVVATAFGNILLCMAVLTEKRLQNMTNYFLASLALSDLLVAIIVMPLAVVVQVYGLCIILLMSVHLSVRLSVCLYGGYGMKVAIGMFSRTTIYQHDRPIICNSFLN